MEFEEFPEKPIGTKCLNCGKEYLYDKDKDEVYTICFKKVCPNCGKPWKGERFCLSDRPGIRDRIDRIKDFLPDKEND